MKIRLALISGLLASLSCALAIAQTYTPFPGSSVDQRTRSMQERVESIYADGNFDRALLIYEKELAPLGDKYAQYMVGYMHLRGEGIAEDRTTALAWFRLAAERGEPLLERVRDELLAEMSPEQVAASDEIYIELWKDIGDRALILDLIQRDMETLKSRTGSRIPGSATGGPTVIVRPSGEPVSPNFYRDVRARLEARLEYLDAKVEIDDDVLSGELERIRGEEARVKAELVSLDN